MPALPAKRDGNGLPVFFDRECDIDIPRQLFSSWIPERGQRSIIRPLTAIERGKLQARADALTQACEPHAPEDQHQVEADIAAMFNGFRALRQQQGDDVEATVHITRHVLRDFPAWAIAKGCMKIATNQAGLDRRFAPNDSEIYDVVHKIVADYRKSLQSATALLSAPVEQPIARDQSRIDAQVEEVRSKLGAPGPRPYHVAELPAGDGRHAQRVAEDLKARARRRESAEGVCGNG